MATRPQPPPTNVLSHVFKNSFSPGELLQFRPVCKEWAGLIGKETCSEKIIYKINSDPESIKSFHSLHASFRPKHIRLVNLDWTGNGPTDNNHHAIYTDLTLHHAGRLESLQFENCNLVAVTFLQLIASCPNLRSIEVTSCPSVYNGNENMLNWGFCPSALNHALSGVRRLEVTEARIPEKDLAGLTFEMKSLRVVRISCNDRALLPRYAIITLLNNNNDNLEELTLGGRLFEEDISNETEEEDDVVVRLEALPILVTLRSLALLRCHFDTFERSTVFHTLFKKCPNLHCLQISKANLDHVSFDGLPFLTELEIMECSLTKGTFEDVRLTGLQKLKVIPQQDIYTEELEDSIVKLFKRELPKLETLQLKLVTGGESLLKMFEPRKLPSLVHLALNGFPDIVGRRLRQLVKSFPGLKSLALTNCEDLVDGNLCPGSDGEVEGSLSNLKELRYLSLIGTSIKNRTLLECLPHLKKLECVRLDGTGVDKPGLELFFTVMGVKEDYPAFHYITLTSCENCRLSIEEIGYLKGMVPHVNIACTIDISELQFSK